MRERVLVVVPQRGEAYQRGLVVQDLIHDRLHGPLHLLHVGRPAHPDRVDDLLRDGHRARVGALRRLFLPFLVLGVLVGLERGLDADVGDAGVRQLLRELEDLGRGHLFRRIRQQQRDEDLQLLALHALVDPDCADAALPQHAEDVGERGVVVEIEAEAGGVDENELALQPQLDLLLHVQQVLRRGGQIIQRLLHLGVLDRIELERANRRVEHDQEFPPGVAQESVRGLDGLGDRALGRTARGHVPTSRSARVTALRTSGSLSWAARSRTARASGVRTLPSAIAAQARVSGSTFRASSPLAASIFSSAGIPLAPTIAPNASKNVIFSVRSRSEEHTSELQSPYDLVCRLLLEKKKKKNKNNKLYALHI